MNALTLLIVSACVLALGYRYYCAFITAKILVMDETRNTPAHTMEDGKDYMPMNKWVLFGHHFAAIAGAGPLIGPVLAAQYGYMPGALWILIGGVFAGAVHDLIILFASVRHKGKALYKIAARETGPVAGAATAVATLFIIVVAMAGLAVAVVNALHNSPWGFFTVSMTIPIAILVGLYMFVWRKGKITEGTIIGVTLLFLSVIGGHWIMNSPYAHHFNFGPETLKIILPIYGFLAAALPVWLLLAPRDYLSTYMKIGTVFLLAIGIAVVHPNLNMPAFTQYIHGNGPIVPGPVWPYVCITIACGAISGFHSLIGSGTTPKMVDNERDIPFIGYGAMVLESFVGMIALIAATSLYVNDYLAINTTAAVWQNLHLTPIELPHLEKLTGESLLNRPGGAVSLAVGMAYIFNKIPGMDGIMQYWYHFAIMFEALFILTTIDAGTRVARYILGESIGHFIPKFDDPKWYWGGIICAATVSFAWGYLLYEGNITTIWPMFGVANQLLATIALAIGTTIILKNHPNKKSYALISFIPFLFIGATTIAAAQMNILNVYLPGKMVLNIIMSLTMLVLAGIIIIDSVVKWIKILKEQTGEQKPEIIQGQPAYQEQED
ncbi:MAG: carbon starvation protein A [Firmicutes bacterium]|nr:carbon starvation protein A [Bacillota bacterium]